MRVGVWVADKARNDVGAREDALAAGIAVSVRVSAPRGAAVGVAASKMTLGKDAGVADDMPAQATSRASQKPSSGCLSSERLASHLPLLAVRMDMTPIPASNRMAMKCQLSDKLASIVHTRTHLERVKPGLELLVLLL